ncbi:MAG: phosphatidate cytidylyltransferase [Planctomycetota bacterium]
MLRTRLILGPLMILAIIGLGWLDLKLPDWTAGGPELPVGVVAAVVVAALTYLVAMEIAALARAKGVELPSSLAVVCGWCGLGAWLISMWGTGGSIAPAAGLGLVAFVVALAFATRAQESDGAFAATGAALVAFVYPGLTIGHLLGIRVELGIGALVWVIITAKACDIGAYFSGRAIGRTPLMKWLSPGKTVEGLIGGVLLAAAVGEAGRAIMSSYGVLELTPGFGAMMGVVLGLTGHFGDLLASTLKRDAGLKHSGRTLPGFGGWIDVMDSLLTAVPAAYWLFRIT